MRLVRISYAFVPAVLLNSDYPGADEIQIAIERTVRDGTIKLFLYGEEAADWVERLHKITGGGSRLKAVATSDSATADTHSERIVLAETANFHLEQHLERTSSDFAIEFYVGRGHPASQLERTIPLEGQYGFGVANALAYIVDNSGVLDLFQYADLQAFIHQAQSFYERDDAGAELLQKATAVAEFIGDALGSDVAAIFGSGFPFYAFDPDGRTSVPTAPTSVRRYFDDQASYFDRKTLDANAYRRHRSKTFDAPSLKREVNVEVDRNDFAMDLFTNVGREAPQQPAGPHSLQGWKRRNIFVLEADVWPCQLCAKLQFPEFYPDQMRIKQTNTECLDCNQTPLMLRNVMGAASDVDLMVVVDDRSSTAARLKAKILAASEYYLFDTDFVRTFSGDGPIDLFLLERAEVVDCFSRLATPQWSGSAVPATALWCPTTEIEARLDLSFAVSFSPLLMSDPELEACFLETRRGFAAGQPVDEIVDALQRGSRWMEQILSNEEVVGRVGAQLVGWRS